jgi:hypothetical protein
MIKYALACEHAHSWEAWFDSIAGYETQLEAGLVECPFCGSRQVEKAPMAPAVVSSRKARDTPTEETQVPVAMADESLALPEPVKAFFQSWKEHIEKNYDYVGDKFATQARAMHEGDEEKRLIYGLATPEEARELLDDGISIAPLPPLASPKPIRGFH